MRFPSARALNFIGFILCILALAASYYFEYVKHMEPCLLCVLQRWIVMLLSMVFLVAFLHHPKKIGTVIYSVITFLVSIAGIAAAGRQVWLQHRPERANDLCIPGLEYLLQAKPFHEVLKLMFQGGRDCAEVVWRFLSLTMAEWVLIFFAITAFLSLVQMIRNYCRGDPVGRP